MERIWLLFFLNAGGVPNIPAAFVTMKYVLPLDLNFLILKNRVELNLGQGENSASDCKAAFSH